MRNKLAKYASEHVVLALEGSSRSSTLGLAWMLFVMGSPVITVLAAKGGYIMAAGSFVLLGALCVSIFVGLSGGPSDFILTANSLHLLWRSLTDARHQAISLASIEHADLALKRGKPAMSSVIIRTADGKSVRLDFMWSGRRGVFPSYKVQANTSSQAFDPPIHNANHARAFLLALREALQLARTAPHPAVQVCDRRVPR